MQFPMALAVLADPTLGGSVLAVLFLVAILRRDKLGLQRYHAAMTGRDKNRCNPRMSVVERSRVVLGNGAVITTNASRSVLLRTIQGD